MTFGTLFRKFFLITKILGQNIANLKLITLYVMVFTVLCVYRGHMCTTVYCESQRITLKSRVSPPTWCWSRISLVISAIAQCSRLTGPAVSRWFSYLCLLSCYRSSGITDVCHTGQIFMCGLGIKLRPASLSNKACYLPSHNASPQNGNIFNKTKNNLRVDQ